MLTYPKSTMRVRRMPMHLSSGHVTFMPGKFYPPFCTPPNFPQSDLVRRADSRWALPQISSFLFFPSRNLRAPWADRREILHDAPKYVQFYNLGPKFWGSLPKKFLGAINMQNLARFRSTSKFGVQFLRNVWRYSKSVSYLFDTDFSRVRRNKSGEVRSSNLGDLDVELNPPKAHYLEDHISAPRGCCAPPNFYTR